ncbi:unnamed protein product [Citrullus colocynthis]|uniref:Uncharacterized protein n=1 Tax=Citrullus colocynthis TaxID=252529 RepID=A0ABP0YXE5_9ROSI
MDVTKISFLVGLLAFLCLSLGSAHRVLKNNHSENQLISDSVSSGQDNHLQNSSHAELKSIPKGSIPKFSSVGPTNGDCCNYGNICGGYSCCGGSSGCPTCYTCSPCQWQECQGCQGCQECQDCQGCQSCGCQVRMNDSKVKQESIQASEPEPPTVTIVPPIQPADHNIKSNGGLV